jgi:leucyl/phenylalanyl-tRNA--protein transferase
VGAGGDFQPSTVVAAYRRGVFPWPHAEAEFLWFSPDPRAVLPLDGLHIALRLGRTIRSGRFRITIDAAFEEVMRCCALARPEGTWITPALLRGYVELHRLGWAHSVEVWTPKGELAGGLYGVGVGAMFGAESMFHRVTDASKAAMVALVQHARAIGLELIDIQVLTEHTERMGGVEVSRDEYLAWLAAAVEREVRWG